MLQNRGTPIHNTVDMITHGLVAILICCLAAPAWAAGPDTDKFLTTGQFDQGITALEAHLKVQPKDDNARFGLGMIRLVKAIESFGQKHAAYVPQTYGNADLKQVFGTIPAPKEPLTYPRLRQIQQEWLDDLARVEAVLSKIEAAEVKLPIHVANVSLKFGGPDGESLNLLPLLRESRITAQGKEEDFVVAFDRADVDWLRGYCHLMSAVFEVGLAYDGQEFFDIFMPRVLQHVKTPYQFVVDEATGFKGDNPFEDGGRLLYGFVADIIAAIHVTRFPVIEPKRMTVALAHLEATVPLSRQMWKHVLAETDDDQEWIPSPKQKGAINVAVTQEMIDHWQLALDELEKILQGKKLLPFWRGKTELGVNLRQVFVKPGRLDPILWLQGAAAAPYLEKGDVTSPQTWQKINGAFGGQFPSFAFWFN